jgi:hypothetical protein
MFMALLELALAACLFVRDPVCNTYHYNQTRPNNSSKGCQHNNVRSILPLHLLIRFINCKLSFTTNQISSSLNMPKLSKTCLYSQRNMLQRERCSRLSSSMSSSCSSGSESSSSFVALTHTCSTFGSVIESASLASDLESLALTPRSVQESSKPLLSRSKRTRFNLDALDANDEGIATRCKSAKIVSREDSILNTNLQGPDREWGQFLDVAQWCEDPMPRQQIFQRSSLPYARPFRQSRNKVLAM